MLYIKNKLINSIEFIKNEPLSFDIDKLELKFYESELDLENHPYNKAISIQDRKNSIQLRVWHEDLPIEIINYIEDIGFNVGTYNANLTAQHPGQMTSLHRDKYLYLAKEFDVNPEELIRFWIPITDWDRGQVLGVEDVCFTKWKSGDCYIFDNDNWHWAVNAGYSIRYTLLVTVLKDSVGNVIDGKS